MSVVFRSPRTQQVWFNWEMTMSDAESEMSTIMLEFDNVLHERDEARKLAEECLRYADDIYIGETDSLNEPIVRRRRRRPELPWEVEK